MKYFVAWYCVFNILLYVYINKQTNNEIMTKAQINILVNDTEFITTCAQFAKECGITAADWNANKGHFIGIMLAMVKVHGYEF